MPQIRRERASSGFRKRALDDPATCDRKSPGIEPGIVGHSLSARTLPMPVLSRRPALSVHPGTVDPVTDLDVATRPRLRHHHFQVNVRQGAQQRAEDPFRPPCRRDVPLDVDYRVSGVLPRSNPDFHAPLACADARLVGGLRRCVNQMVALDAAPTRPVLQCPHGSRHAPQSNQCLMQPDQSAKSTSRNDACCAAGTCSNSSKPPTEKQAGRQATLPTMGQANAVGPWTRSYIQKKAPYGSFPPRFIMPRASPGVHHVSLAMSVDLGDALDFAIESGATERLGK